MMSIAPARTFDRERVAPGRPQVRRQVGSIEPRDRFSDDLRELLASMRDHLDPDRPDLYRRASEVQTVITLLLGSDHRLIKRLNLYRDYLRGSA